MNAFDTRLEALAFDYLSLAFSTAVWTWLAVITAAVSFWKVTAAGAGRGPAKSRHSGRRIDEPIKTVSTTTTTAVSLVLETDRSANEGKVRLKRGKFTVCYDENENDGVKGASTATDGGEGRCCGGEWERGLRMREGEKFLGANWISDTQIQYISQPLIRVLDGTNMWEEDMSLGWYRYQDLTVIDGNVVRLWDWEF